MTVNVLLSFHFHRLNLELFKAKDVMRFPVITLHIIEPAAHLAHILVDTTHAGFPIVRRDEYTGLQVQHGLLSRYMKRHLSYTIQVLLLIPRYIHTYILYYILFLPIWLTTLESKWIVVVLLVYHARTTKSFWYGGSFHSSFEINSHRVRTYLSILAWVIFIGSLTVGWCWEKPGRILNLSPVEYLSAPF